MTVYPLVGLLIAALLLAPLGLLIQLGFSPPPAAAAGLLLFLWVFITGALHIDGLADSADGWLGGFGDRNRMLTIMKDPRSGAGALAAVGSVLILKFSALQTVIAEGYWLAILLATILGRSAVLLLVITTPYIPTSQLGADLANHCPRGAAKRVLLAVAAFVLLLSPFEWRVLPAAGAALLCFYYLRLQMMQKLGGATGDTTGAAIELIETTVLLTAALLTQ